MKWTQGSIQHLKEGVKAAQVGLASGIVGIARLVLWDQEMSRRLEAAMNKDEVAIMKR